ncbi:MAG: hypothetical protein WDN10_05275 [bacterium]
MDVKDIFVGLPWQSLVAKDGAVFWACEIGGPYANGSIMEMAKFGTGIYRKCGSMNPCSEYRILEGRGWVLSGTTRTPYGPNDLIEIPRNTLRGFEVEEVTVALVLVWLHYYPEET